ncbi:MAG: hypothetical protein JWN30_1417 [Bacilli bacterium]|nr:hypothetical protein [Bacilli bacterium]
MLIAFLLFIGCSAPGTAVSSTTYNHSPINSDNQPNSLTTAEPDQQNQIDQTDTSSTSNPNTIDVAAQWQEPELLYGCEVTSVSMLLDAAGHPVDKMELADQVPKDPTAEVKADDGTILSWGDPDTGFVGDITGDNDGYGVNHGPIVKLVNQYLPGKALDLTGSPFNKILDQVASGKPVVVWTTVDFTPTDVWVSWQGPNGPVNITYNEHAALLVGFNDGEVFVNDPLDDTAAKAVDRESFMQSWEQLGEQAVSFN